MKIGVLGGGQLGRMLVMAGLPWDWQFRTLDPNPRCPMSVIAEQIVGEYEDYAALADFVSGLDAVTYEFENVPVKAVRWLADRVPVFPNPAALEFAQDRLTEKEFFRGIGAGVAGFRSIDSRNDFDRAIAEIGTPAVLKTRRFGYDGKGQIRIHSQADAETAWERLGGRPLILEQLIKFDREMSIIGVRGGPGRIEFYPLIENEHRDGILRRSVAPFDNEVLLQRARDIARQALESLNYIGALAIEFFAVGDQLFVNEMAPRVHNSGHWTIEGAATSQFANHLRAGMGLPLGATYPLGHSAMINVIGTFPDVNRILEVPGASLHLYGKSPRPNRKLGHITVVASDAHSRDERVKILESLV